MTVFNNEDHRYDFDQASGNLIDKVGSKDLTPVGSVVFNPSDGFVRLNGVDAAFEYTDDGAGSGQRDFSGNVWEYREWIHRDTTFSGNNVAHHGSASAGAGPSMNWDDSGVSARYRGFVEQNNVNGRADFILPGGRLPIIGERFWYSYSLTQSDLTWRQVLLSKNVDPDDNVALAISGSGALPVSDRPWSIGSNESGTNFAQIDVYQYGIGNGEIFTEEELTADGLLALFPNGDSRGRSSKLLGLMR